MSRAKRTRKKENARVAREARAAAAKREKRRTAVIRFGSAFLVLILIIAFISFITRDDDNSSASDSTTTTVAADTSTTLPAERAFCTVDPGSAQTVKMTTSKGEIDIALDSTVAPTASAHFAELANNGFYDGLTFHRVVADFMIQGGDPKGDGTGGSGSSVVGEVPTDNYPLGSLAAAKTGSDPAGTFDAQFFIVTGSQGATLANDYARFGCVTSGLDVAEQISHLDPGDGSEKPSETVTMDKVEIVDGPPVTTTSAPATDTTTATTAPTTTES